MKVKKLYKKVTDYTYKDYIKRKCNIDDFDEWFKGKNDNYADYVNIDKAIELFNKHINTDNEICILQDCDLDGVYSSTMLARWIATKYQRPITMIFHKEKKHGLNDDYVMNKLKNKKGLLIIPDAGTNDVNECKKLSEHLDILILDHHEIEVDNPYAIVVNNQMGNVNHDGSGTTTTYKFMCAIENKTDLIEYESYVFLSLISDIMSFKSIYNRYFIYNQLVLNNYFKTDSLLQWLPYGDIKTIDDIQKWHSLLNAIIRMGQLKDKKQLSQIFVKQSDYREFTQLKELGKQMKALQREIVDNTISYGIEYISSDTDNVIVGITKEDTQLSGLIAFFLTLKYDKPCIVVHPTLKGILKGSARSTDAITNLKELVQQSKTTMLAQGHEGAFGIEFENIDKIKECISFVSEKLPTVELEVASYIECKSDLDYVLSQRDNIYDCLWGTNLKEPKFIYTDSITKENISLIGKKQNVLKINKDFEVCKFQYDIDKFSEAFPFDKFKFKIYCLGTPNLNTYKQVTKKQFLAEKVASVPIE